MCEKSCGSETSKDIVRIDKYYTTKLSLSLSLSFKNDDDDRNIL